MLSVPAEPEPQVTPASGLARRPESVPAELSESLRGDGENIFVTLSPELIDELSSGLTPRTRRAYRNNLLHFYAWIENTGALASGLNKSITETYLVQVYNEGAVSLAYVDQILASIRWYAKKMIDRLLDDIQVKSLLPLPVRSRLVMDMERVRAAHRPSGQIAEAGDVGRRIPLDELELLLAVCEDGNPAGVRDRAMFSVAIQTGMRVHEIAGLPLSRVTEIPEGYSILVIGKGKRRRKVSPWVSGGGATTLRAWLELRGFAPGAVFAKIDRYQHIHVSRGGMTTDALRRILHQRVEKAGLPTETEWHDFRRTLITNLIQESGLEVANKFIGHATLQQTAQYGRDVEQRVREAVAKLPMPAALR
jgi:integrase/recombinase XerD